jgi:hypothetical protein
MNMAKCNDVVILTNHKDRQDHLAVTIHHLSQSTTMRRPISPFSTPPKPLLELLIIMSALIAVSGATFSATGAG